MVDCDRFLDNHRFFQKKDGFVCNIIWWLEAGPEAKQLRDRVAFTNTKVGTCLVAIFEGDLANAKQLNTILKTIHL